MAFRLYPFKVPFEDRGRIAEIPADFYKTVSSECGIKVM